MSALLPPSVLADLLYPPACWACGSPIGRQEDGLCPSCPLVPPGDRYRRCAEPQGPGATPPDCANCRGRALHFGRVCALARYEGALRELVRRAKYSPDPSPWAWLGDRLAEAAAAEPWIREAEAVVSVPSSRAARGRRGFHPAELLARRVSARLGIPMLDCLERPGPSAPQVGQGRAGRLSAVEGAFRVRKGRSPAGLRILLVDDVMTTAATAAACAGVLRQAGARGVDVAAAGR